MGTFNRENRYIVLKNTDLNKVPEDLLRNFYNVLSEINQYIPNRNFCVLEEDWPEYEEAWLLIEKRV